MGMRNREPIGGGQYICDDGVMTFLTLLTIKSLLESVYIWEARIRANNWLELFGTGYPKQHLQTTSYKVSIPTRRCS